MPLPCVPRSTRGKLATLVVVGILVLIAIVVVMHNWSSSEEKQENVLIPVHRDAPIMLALYPSDRAVMAGDSFQVTCLATGANRVFFEIPDLTEDLRSSVMTHDHDGGAMLIFKRVELGHQAKYVCHAVGERGMEKIGIVDLLISEAAPAANPSQETQQFLINADHPSEKRKEEGNGDRGVVAPANSSVFPRVPSFASMDERAKYQREQVDAFCKRHNLDHLKYELPTPLPGKGMKDNNVYSYHRHMLLDDKHKILFCFVPKVGCTNLKLVVFVNQGIIRRSELTKARDAVNQGALEGAMFRNSFISVTDIRRQTALHTYYKYTMFRNPLERLASGYRSKVERFPLVGFKLDKPHFNWLRNDIYSTQHREEYLEWRERGGATPINISFADFVEYWATHKIVNKVDGYLDEHFLLITEMCQPCRTRFDFYGNFHHFDRDAEVLIQMVGASSSDLRQGYYTEDTSTEERMRLYYSSLSRSQKRAVLQKIALELEFHYTIFPEERDSHKQILGVDIDIPLS